MNIIRCASQEYTPSKIICVGRNFPDHVKEMGGSEMPSEPVIFIKPNSAIVFNPREVKIPKSFGLLHHEVELCLVIDDGKIAGYAVGIDFTLRDRQTDAKKQGAPWTIAKGFDGAAVFGEFIKAQDIKDALSLDISLSVNGKVKQKGNTRDMIFHPQRIIEFVSQFMTIETGDILMCGTPSGVGEVHDKDKISANIKGLPRLEFTVRRI